jgi:long-chain acyl-CoA synthetase
LIIFDENVNIHEGKGIFFVDLMDKEPTQISMNKQVDILKESKGEELATIIYTSGTTGEPKGVMLTHSNFFHQVDLVDNSFDVGPGDRSLCFLPLSHVFERAWSYYVFYKGVTNHYLGDHTQIMDYFKEVKPTCMVSVPRLFEKIYSTVNVKLTKASPIKRSLFKWAIKVGGEHQDHLDNDVTPGFFHKIQYKLADKLVLGKLREVVGGEIKFFASGGAPLSGEIGEFFSKVGIQIYEGYGLTETSPIISFNTPKERRFGTVGKVAQLVDVKIGSENEIMVKGPNVMKGYYNRPDLNDKSFSDGWFRTGDVGEFDKDGYLKITDRIKDIIITSTGKNVARQRVETVIGKDHYIEQILTIGNGRKFISALVVPYFEALEEYAKEKGIGFSSREMLIKKDEIIQFYRERIEKISSELANYEKIKKFTLLPVEFTQTAGEITPTLKNKRNVIMQRYNVLIDKMYA